MNLTSFVYLTQKAKRVLKSTHKNVNKKSSPGLKIEAKVYMKYHLSVPHHHLIDQQKLLKHFK